MKDWPRIHKVILVLALFLIVLFVGGAFVGAQHDRQDFDQHVEQAYP